MDYNCYLLSLDYFSFSSSFFRLTNLKDKKRFSLISEEEVYMSNIKLITLLPANGVQPNYKLCEHEKRFHNNEPSYPMKSTKKLMILYYSYTSDLQINYP